MEALNGDQATVALMVEEFKKRRDVIVDGLNSIKGLICRKPHGAFYVFPMWRCYSVRTAVVKK